MRDAPPASALRPFPAARLRSEIRAVSSAWIDYNGHMNIGYYGLAFDQALDDIYEHWLDMGASYVKREGMGPFALQEHIHFLRELREGQRFWVEFQLLDADHKRMHMFSQMVAAPEGAETADQGAYVAATAEQLSMNVDHATRRSAPYPDRARARLEALLAAHRDLPKPEQVGAPIGIRRTG